mmetsp:Transcript_3575/g.14887  ORF Transcript_3575/g.14887 Transcript_3575/m.14887 type:complete len:324 (-) Transcript_3575:1816-2787(-)
MQGMRQKSTPGSISAMRWVSSSQRAPSRKRPWIKTPSSGASFTPSSRNGLTAVAKSSVSIAIFVLRAYICSAPVMKPCGKKKPLIQKLGGGPSRTQLSTKATRAKKSSIHEARGFSDGYAAASHAGGTFWNRNAWYMVSSAGDMTTRPLIAFSSSRREDRTSWMSTLNLSISCAQNTPSEFMLPSAILANVVSLLPLRVSMPGSRDAMPSATTRTCSSGVSDLGAPAAPPAAAESPPSPSSPAAPSPSPSPPSSPSPLLLLELPPPPPEAWILMMVSRSSFVSFCCKEMAAFSCSPNTSGGSSAGSDSTKARASSSVPSVGAK